MLLDRLPIRPRRLAVALLLVVATLAVYEPVRHHGFVNYDDNEYVYENYRVRRGLTPDAFLWAFRTTAAENWHPLTWLSHMLDVEMFGLDPSGHHAVSAILHAANSALLFIVLEAMSGGFWQSAVVAALFALHPLHVESVAWIAERKDVLSAFFGFLTLWAYLAYVRNPRPRRYLLVAIFLALGLMAKPMLVTLPFVLLLLDFWPLGRLGDAPGDPAPGSLRSSAAGLIREKIPLFALAAASSAATFVAQARSGAVASLDLFPFADRVRNAIAAYVHYIGKALWPARLAAFYPHMGGRIGVPLLLGMALFLIAVSSHVVLRARRRPYLAVGWLWYLGTLVPVIGLVQVGEQAMADRYTYIPLIGLFIMGAWSLPDLLPQGRYRTPALAALAGIAILASAASARIQALHWRSSATLWEHALRVTERNDVAHLNLGSDLAERGRMAEATEHFREALRINPGKALPLNNLGVAAESQGQIDLAIDYYSQAIRRNPLFAMARANMGVVLFKQGALDNAIIHLQAAIAQLPDNPRLLYTLGLCLDRRGRNEEALERFLQTVLLNPHHGPARVNLGVSLARQNRFSEAYAQYRAAMRVDPGDAAARFNMGVLLERMGRRVEALPHYRDALEIRPDYHEARVNLGMALAGQGDLDGAIAQFREALRTDSRDVKARNAIGVALAEKGRIAEALDHFHAALRIRPDDPTAHFNLGVAMSRQGKADEAIRHLRDGLRLDPANEEALRQLDLAMRMRYGLQPGAPRNPERGG